MKKSWWKVPLYCILASWIDFQLQIRFSARWAIVTLPDGTSSLDSTRFMIISGIIFVITVLIGGIFFFRKMTRRELFCSASVLAVINVVFGLTANKMQGVFALYYSKLTGWNDFISNLLLLITQNTWIIAVIVWLLPPYIFVLFGKKENNAGS